MADKRVQKLEQAGQDDDYDEHTDESAPGYQQAYAFQQFHAADGGHSDGGGKEGQAA